LTRINVGPGPVAQKYLLFGIEMELARSGAWNGLSPSVEEMVCDTSCAVVIVAPRI
jgi:hypothetical protein